MDIERGVVLQAGRDMRERWKEVWTSYRRAIKEKQASMASVGIQVTLAACVETEPELQSPMINI